MSSYFGEQKHDWYWTPKSRRVLSPVVKNVETDADVDNARETMDGTLDVCAEK